MTCAYTREQAIDAILGWSNRYGYSEQFKQFALAVAIGESGLNPCAVGDNGQSHGIYQFYRNGGRGTGIPVETLQNPYWEAEHNLQILHSAFEKYGGDSAWANDPYTTLKYGWKYGQGSIWPSDGQLRGALGSLGSIDVANFDSSWPEPSTQPDTQPQSDTSPQPTNEPSQTSPELSFWMRPVYDQVSLWPRWLMQNAFSGGLERQPSFAFSPPFSGLERAPIGEQPPVPPPPELDLVRQGLTNRTFPPPP